MEVAHTESNGTNGTKSEHACRSEDDARTALVEKVQTIAAKLTVLAEALPGDGRWEDPFLHAAHLLARDCAEQLEDTAEAVQAQFETGRTAVLSNAAE